MLAAHIPRIVFGGIDYIVCVLYFTNLQFMTSSSRTFPIHRMLFYLGIKIIAHVLACNWFANGSLLSHETDVHYRRPLFVFTTEIGGGAGSARLRI